MSDATMTTIANALKYFYLDGLRYQLDEKASVFLTQIEKNSKDIEGLKAVMGLSYGMTGGIGNRAEDGTLPTPNSRKFAQAKWDTKNIFVRVRLSDKCILAARGNRGSFVSILEHELQKAEVDAKRVLSRQAVGDGTGLLATVATVSTDGTTHTCTVDSVKGLYEGMLIDCYTSTTKDTSEAEVTIVDRVNKTVTFVATTAPETGDLIYMAGNKDLELTGLGAVMTADTTLYEIVRATNKWFNPTLKNVNGEISEVGIQEGIDDTEDEVGSVINLLIASKGVRRAYQALLTAQKSQVNTLELKGGWKSLDYNGIGLVGDKYMPAGAMFGLDTNDWNMYQLADWDWLDRDGSMFARVANKAMFEATLRKYCDVGCARPRGQVKWYGITEH